MKRDHETPRQLSKSPSKKQRIDSAQSSNFSSTLASRTTSIKTSAKGQISHERLQKSKAKNRGTNIVDKFLSRSKQMKKQVTVLKNIKNARPLDELKKMDQVTDPNPTKKRKREKRKQNDAFEVFGTSLTTDQMKKAKTKRKVTPDMPPALGDTDDDDLPDLIRSTVTPRSVKDNEEVEEGDIIVISDEERPTLQFDTKADTTDESDDNEEEESAPMPTINFDSDEELASSDSVICLDEEKPEGEHTASLTDDELEDF